MDLSVIMASLISGGVISSIIVWWANRQNVAADTYQQLVDTVTTLNKTLNEEKAKREAESIQFDKKVADLVLEYDKKLAVQKASYEEKLINMKTVNEAEIAKLNLRIDELERERNELLLENRALRKGSSDG